MPACAAAARQDSATFEQAGGGVTLAFAAPPGAFSHRVAPYLRARELEGRVYTDQALRRLPRVDGGHPLAAEWRLRADSTRRLLAHLHTQPAPLSVLEVGCGNGWLANQLAGVEQSRVYALDINEAELRQGARVFAARDNLVFIHGDAVTTDPIAPVSVVVAASAIQYFADLAAFLATMRRWLVASGEVHLLDSPFYAAEELEAARARSSTYYARLGVPEMAGAYHHHALDELEPFTPRIHAAPAARWRRLGWRRASPFWWITISAAAIPVPEGTVAA